MAGNVHRPESGGPVCGSRCRSRPDCTHAIRLRCKCARARRICSWASAIAIPAANPRAQHSKSNDASRTACRHHCGIVAQSSSMKATIPAAMRNRASQALLASIAGINKLRAKGNQQERVHRWPEVKYTVPAACHAKSLSHIICATYEPQNSRYARTIAEG
jgi:hypothetical protein